MDNTSENIENNAVADTNMRAFKSELEEILEAAKEDINSIISGN